MTKELSQIALYLAKPQQEFDDVLRPEKIKPENEQFKIRAFEIDDVEVRSYAVVNTTKKTSQPWIDFINENLDDQNKINFETFSKRPSGLILIKIDSNIFAAAFGVSGSTLLDKSKFYPDFGIKTAMNMCGNTELRQTKSHKHAIITQNINRQHSRPSESLDFGMSDTEQLNYISAQLEKDKNVTLQGKDNLNIKVIGEKKLSWSKLLEYCNDFLEQYQKDTYKELFPNFPNLQNVSEEKIEILDVKLLDNIVNRNIDNVHLSIPEFIDDSEYSFSYSNSPKRDNIIYSYIDIEHIYTNNIFREIAAITIKMLKGKSIYAYSHTQEQILPYMKWSFYHCLVAEVDYENEHYILSNGIWQKFDTDFYNNINTFIEDNIT